MTIDGVDIWFGCLNDWFAGWCVCMCLFVKTSTCGWWFPCLFAWGSNRHGRDYNKWGLGTGLGTTTNTTPVGSSPGHFLKKIHEGIHFSHRVRLLIAATQLPGEFQPASFIVLGRPEWDRRVFCKPWSMKLHFSWRGSYPIVTDDTLWLWLTVCHRIDGPNRNN